MPGQPRDNRPPMVEAMQWVHQIIAVSLEMVLPAVLGWWLDVKWGTGPWLLIVGAVLGFLAAMTHLMQMVAQADKKNEPRDKDSIV